LNAGEAEGVTFARSSPIAVELLATLKNVGRCAGFTPPTRNFDLDLQESQAEQTMTAAVTQRVGGLFRGRYEAIELLGEGGMGRVYRGRQHATGRPVAIKVMHEQIAAQPRFRQRFEREIRLMTAFSHPHAVALLDASLDDPRRPWLVMEYVRGVSLEELLAHGMALPAERVGRLLGQLCWVLSAAHAAAILHRDISCANILVVEAGTPAEQLKVLDFGLARLGSGPYIALEKLTGGNSIGPGTPDYLPPEQIRGDEVDHRADLYSVGVVLFKMLTGRLPFGHFTETRDILLAHLEEDPPAFSAVNPEVRVPAAVEAVVRGCLAKYPHERPASARELAQRFHAALGQQFIEWESAPAALPAASPQCDTQIDLAGVLDQMEAWMPECIAVVKLRGFVADLGGEVIESVPGLIRMKLPMPSAPVAPPRKRLWPFQSRVPPPEPRHVSLDLHMQKTHPNQNRLQVTVVLNPDDHRVEDDEQHAFCDKLCRTLRGYLMSSR
jgi:serine/threonine-protein kinase